MGGFDVAQDAAGADGGELLVVPDEADAAAGVDDVADDGVEAEGVGHAGFVDDHQRPGPELFDPAGRVAVLEVPGELGDGVRCSVDLLAESGGRNG